MRLINVSTTRLAQFFGSDKPEYAILSHTWGKDEDELTIQDIKANTNPTDRRGPGWDKLAGLCKQASADGLEWAWLDTCCIDKTNSTELGEAINSMFRWYQNAKVCYAYLSDVEEKTQFEHSRWFTRGWTLQELLAPRHIRFYDSQWNVIGTKRELSVGISNTTGIPRPFLLGIASLREASVAQRMSWASRRETKRSEDMAYCLLGIFGFSMPMIYGEEGMAFIRLQEEIMRHIRDDSILAWQAFPADSDNDNVPIGAMAASPAAFAFSGDVIRGNRQTASSMEPLYVQGGCIVARRPVARLSCEYLVLDCYRKDSSGMSLGIPISPSSSARASETNATAYSRLAAPNMLHSGDMPMEEPDHAIRMHATSAQIPSTAAPRHIPRFYIDNELERKLRLAEVIPKESWDRDVDVITPDVKESTDAWQAFMRFETSSADSHDFIVVLEMTRPFNKLAHIKHHVLICTKQTKLDDTAQYFAEYRPEAHGSHYATDGTTNVEVTVHHELVGRQMMFVMKFRDLDPDVSFSAQTVDSSYEMRHLSQEKRLIELLTRDMDHARDIQKNMDKIQTFENSQKTLQGKLMGIELNIRELEKRRTAFQQAITGCTSGLSTAQTDVKLHREARIELADNLKTACSQTSALHASVPSGRSVVQDWMASLANRLMSQIGKTDSCTVDPIIELVPDEKGQLLFYATRKGWLTVVCLLVAHGADVNSTDNSGTPLLMYAQKAGNSELVNFLVEHGARDNEQIVGNSSFRDQSFGREAAAANLILNFEKKWSRAETPSATELLASPNGRVAVEPKRLMSDQARDIHHRSSEMYYRSPLLSLNSSKMATNVDEGRLQRILRKKGNQG